MLGPAGLMSGRDATPITAPDAPSNLIATASGTSSVDVSWQDNSDDETLFRIQYDTDVNFGSPSEVTASANATSRAVTGLADETTYHFRVRAENAEGNSAYSNVDSATTDALSPPAAPSGLSASTVDADSISLSWNDNSSDEDDFQIQYDTDSGFGSPSSTTAAANATSKTINGLSEGTQYYFRIRARNTDGNSNWSGSDSAYTKLGTPGGFSGTQMGDPLPAATGFVRFTWNDNSSKEAGYSIYKDGSPFDTMPANTTQYDVDNPQAAGTWKVKATHGTIPDSDFSGSDSDPF